MFTNLVLLCSYGVVALVAMHVMMGNWSGLASVGIFAATVFSTPYLLVRAWQPRGSAHAGAPMRARWVMIAGFPIVCVLFWTIGLVVSKL
jgi:type VI protein secretion system component VasK